MNLVQVLERFVATKFYLYLALRHSENSFLFTLSQLSRVWSRMDLDLPANLAAFCAMLSIHFQKASEEQGGPSRKRATFGPNEWEQIVTELPYKKTHIPIHATWNGPDILFKLHGHASDETLHVGAACKGRWSSRGTEIGKFLDTSFRSSFAQKFKYELYVNCSKHQGGIQCCYRVESI